MKKTVVLFLLPHLDLGGGARRIKVYCDYLNRTRFIPVVVVRNEDTKRDIDAMIGKTTPRLFSSDAVVIARFAKKHHVSVAYTWYDGQFHQDLFKILCSLREQGVKLIANNVFSYVDERMDALLDLSVFQTKMMLEIKFKRNFPSSMHWNPKRYAVLPNPINDDYFSTFQLTKKQRDEARASFGFTGQDIVIGRFGRNDIVKWGDQLLGTLIRLRSHPHIKFLIVGMPRSRRILVRLLQRCFPSLQSTVRIVEPSGNDKMVMTWMQCVDIVGHSVKIGEGCSNAINEVMYWGKPVITNSTPHCDNGQVEQVEHEKTGIIANTTSQWVEAVLHMAQSRALRLRLGNAGSRKVRRYFAASTITQQLEYDIEMVCGRKKKVPPSMVQQSDLTSFASWYDAFVLKHVVPSSHGVQLMLDTIKRACDYIEYRMFNG